MQRGTARTLRPALAHLGSGGCCLAPSQSRDDAGAAEKRGRWCCAAGDVEGEERTEEGWPPLLFTRAWSSRHARPWPRAADHGCGGGSRGAGDPLIPRFLLVEIRASTSSSSSRRWRSTATVAPTPPLSSLLLLSSARRISPCTRVEQDGVADVRGDALCQCFRPANLPRGYPR
jgi:hypothetical protein